MSQNTLKSKKVKYGNKTGTKKQPHFGNYDIYSNPKPKDTVRIKYTTVNDVKFTINKLESLYKRKLRPHARISKIANVLEQRLRVLKQSKSKTLKNKGSNIANDKAPNDLAKRHKLAKRYFEFLKKRTGVRGEENRRALEFKC